MKIRSYKLLFHIFSFLADRTNGASLFVRYKLILGTLIIGLSGISCGKSKPQQPFNNEPIVPKPDISQITCYDSIASPQRTVDSIEKTAPPCIEIEELPIPLHITCYDIAVIDTIQEVVMCYIQILDEPDIPEPLSEPVMLYGSVQHPPVSPVGDLDKFIAWVQNNIEYPRIMLDNKIQGRIVVNFIVDEDGNITEPKIVQNIIPDADKEVLRLITSCGKWALAWHHGEKVKTSILIPVKFVLPEE
ncbi:TonB family protein [Dysgonomonas hofstadii]|uniref:TonB family protein n=1 Tax=Dysgonomonas hofstadii TaxID=637886 RepID=A0A840CS07_9BACT|nr:energy transducer TonB [Dysgonomonas hofstadii]MBB4036928.1 TonB family protein [Dysgonomonas hofstadii]